MTSFSIFSSAAGAKLRYDVTVTCQGQPTSGIKSRQVCVSGTQSRRRLSIMNRWLASTKVTPYSEQVRKPATSPHLTCLLAGRRVVHPLARAPV